MRGTMARDARPKPLFFLLGFPVYVPLGAWLGIALVAAINAPAFERDGGLVSTAVFAIGLYLTVLVHELAHAIAARRTGHDVLAITLGILGGATLYDEERNPNPKHEFGVALAGPVSSIALGFALDAGANGIGNGAAATVVAGLGFMNVVLGFMNLLPASPLDGGHVFEAIVWKVSKSRRTGMRATAVVGWLLGTLALAIGLQNLDASGSGLLVFLGVLFTFDASAMWQRSLRYR